MKLRILATVIITGIGMGRASFAELVFEDSKKVYSAVEQSADAEEIDDSEDDVAESQPVAVRQVQNQPVQVIQAQPTQPQYVQPQYVQQVPIQQQVQQPIQQAPIYYQQAPQQPMIQGPSAAVAEPASRAELLRRQRLRNELQNEDLLQARMEELRLKDESKRADKIFGNGDSNYESPYATDGSMDTVMVGPMAQAATPADQVVYTQAAPVAATTITATADEIKGEDEVMFYVTPKAGIANFIDNSWYDIDPRFTAGLNLGFSITDYFSVETGYAYSEYDVSLKSGSGNAYGGGYGNGFQPAFNGYISPYNYPTSSGNYTKITMKQNVFDALFKLHLLSRSSKFRPFVGAGLGYGKSFINYDERTLKWLKSYDPYNQQSNQDYKLSQYLGILSGGFDIQMTDKVAVGLAGRYYKVFSSDEDTPLYNYAFYNPGTSGGYLPPPPNFGSFTSDQKALVTGSLAETSFYNVTLGVTFGF